eukprot:TRINITY_DN254_c0_g1_i1.p1 TRINITY_DN254_c0_g1~~TRINITY_DN254_c0_g1_i1.p1  ORF type:complete len:1040 (+),score=198.37 TRINITY_DN254_c0_g1_i1:471-3590(+)
MPMAVAPNDFNTAPEAFYKMIERKDYEAYQQMGSSLGIVDALQTDARQGITSASLARRVEMYGPNTLPPPKQVSFLALVWECLKDNMLRLLIVAAILSIIFGVTINKDHGSADWIEGVAILISVTVVVTVTSANDYEKAKKFAELNKQTSRREVQVVRDGQTNHIDSTEVVVGDVLLVEGGQNLVADCILLDGQDLKTDESAATGESDIQKKTLEKDPFLLSGTNVTEGEGRAVVVAVGVHSFSGVLTLATRTEMAETPLQEKLGRLADYIGKGGLAIALVMFVALCIKEGVQIKQGKRSFKITNFLNHLIIAITLVVVVVPEGLPLAVTIALAYSMKAMLADNCLVRVLASCETMGAATAICSDKTGTLTTNVMTVVQGHVCGENFVFEGYGITPKDDAVTIVNKDRPRLRTPASYVEQLCFSISINSTAAERPNENGVLQWVGNKTEHGLLGFVKRMGFDFMRQRNSPEPNNKRSYPFTSAKKRMTTLVRNPRGMTIHVKGASEMVLASCSQYLNQDGATVPITPEVRATLEGVIDDMARQGNRTIGVAYLESHMNAFPEEEPEEQLIFLGVLGIQDPIREEVPGAVEMCRHAGITIRMVTGDNLKTAIAIAKKCGLYVEGKDLALQGPEFRELHQRSPEALKAILPKLRVLARSSPTDKHILVNALMEMGEVVGVTGDGTNDAPALKLANVGFAMNSGTEVAKGASAMVLMDDNFATVVRAVMWGRAVNDNIRKFLQFQLTINVCGAIFTFVGAVASDDNKEPLSAVQLLWLNLIMDTLAALSLATEKPTEKSLNRPPVFKQAPLISKKMWTFILGHAFYQLGLMFFLLYYGHVVFRADDCGGDEGTMQNGYCRDGPEHKTCIFNTFIWLQIFNEFNARKLYGEQNIIEGVWSRSRLMFLLLLVTACFQVFAVEVAGKFMQTTRINGAQWGTCLAFGATELIVGIFVRLVPVKDFVPPVQPAPLDDHSTLMHLQHVVARRKSLSALGDFKVAFKHGDPSLHFSYQQNVGGPSGRVIAVQHSPRLDTDPGHHAGGTR